MSGSSRVLLVCTGNTCRSPMAEAVLRELRPDWEIRSGGLSADPGSPASLHSRGVVSEQGLDLSAHRSRSVDAELVDWAEHILCMTGAHLSLLLRQFPQASGKASTLIEGDVQDPYGQSLGVYRRTLSQIRGGLEDWLQQQRVP